MAAPAGCMPARGRVYPWPSGAPRRPRLARLRLPKTKWVWVPAPGDDSDCTGCEQRPEAPPRHIFDARACAPAPQQRAAQAGPPSSGAAEEIGALLRGLAASAAAGATPRERMLAVCRVALAHVATWLKPATDVPAGGRSQIGALIVSTPSLYLTLC